ncbi:MAG: V8-like Glu-specific endopeptidase [Candidatus Azotimanducaceae bacterium]|jgi:V8-like Glu-specific endopeptidase
MTILNTSIPVIIETGADEWPYSVRGTFFTIKIGGESYVVTARHVVHGNDENTVFFRYKNNSRFSLPLDQEIKNTSYMDESSPEYTDIILYRINKNETDEEFISIDLNLSETPWERLSKGDNLVIRGYPSELQKVLDSGVKEQAVIINAKYLNRAVTENCHDIELFPTETFTFHDGYSGSPVFLKKNSDFKFAGILIKADSFNNKGLFVDASVLLKMVNS